MWRRGWCLLGLVVSALLMLTACGSAATATPTSAGTGVVGGGYGGEYGGGYAGSGTAASPASAAGGATVEVRLSDFKIDMPSSVKAGMTSFQVTNAGATAHNFEIEGNGLEKKFDANLSPGETKTLQVELKPGSYEVYCPVDGHKGMGMQLTLKVG